MDGSISKKKLIAIILASILGIVVLAFGVWGWRYATAPISGGVEKQEIVQSGEFRIYSYNHFFDLLVEINGLEAGWDAQYDRSLMLDKNSEEHSRVQSNLSAIKTQIERQKRQYNADALKEETIGIFRDSNLPFKVDTSPHEYGHRTEIKYGGY